MDTSGGPSSSSSSRKRKEEEEEEEEEKKKQRDSKTPPVQPSWIPSSMRKDEEAISQEMGGPMRPGKDLPPSSPILHQAKDKKFNKLSEYSPRTKKQCEHCKEDLHTVEEYERHIQTCLNRRAKRQGDAKGSPSGKDKGGGSSRAQGFK